MKRTILAVCVVVLCFAVQSQAQDLTFFAGYLNPGKVDLTSITNDLTVRSTGIYGGRLEFDFHKVLGIEESFAFSPRLFSSNLIPDVSDTKGFLYNSNLVLNLPLRHLVPYVTAGVGFLKPYGSGFQPFDARFAGNYGGGVKFERLIGPVGLTFDVRGYSIPNVEHQTLNLLEASGGLTFSFGRGR